MRTGWSTGAGFELRVLYLHAILARHRAALCGHHRDYHYDQPGGTDRLLKLGIDCACLPRFELVVSGRSSREGNKISSTSQVVLRVHLRWGQSVITIKHLQYQCVPLGSEHIEVSIARSIACQFSGAGALSLVRLAELLGFPAELSLRARARCVSQTLYGGRGLRHERGTERIQRRRHLARRTQPKVCSGTIPCTEIKVIAKGGVLSQARKYPGVMVYKKGDPNSSALSRQNFGREP